MNHYETLELPLTASMEEIKRSFRRLALRWHPDKNPGNEAEATERFKQLNSAYELLSNPDKKRRYDRFYNNPSSTFFGVEKR